jgi:hypothetical protein
MNVDLSTDQLKTISLALAVGIEVARERLGKGEYVDPSMLLRALPEEDLKKFVRISQQLENDLDRRYIPQSEGEHSGGRARPSGVQGG